MCPPKNARRDHRDVVQDTRNRPISSEKQWPAEPLHSPLQYAFNNPDTGSLSYGRRPRVVTLFLVSIFGGTLASCTPKEGLERLRLSTTRTRLEIDREA